MWTNYHAKFHQNPMKESEVIKLRRTPLPPRLDRGMESPRLDRVKVGHRVRKCINLNITDFRARFQIGVSFLQARNVFCQFSIRESPAAWYPIRFNSTSGLIEHALRILRKATWGVNEKTICSHFQATVIPALKYNVS